MKLVCPSCGAVHSAEAWQNDPVARQCLKLAGEMPHAVASRCFAYLSLFRKHGSSLQWRTVLTLLSELKDRISDPYVQWKNQVARPCNAQFWADGMEQVIQHPPQRLPLKSHGYLRSVVYDIADSSDRQAEVKRNQSERDGSFHSRHSGESRNPVEPERVSLEIMKDIRKQNMGTRKHEGTKTRKDND